MKFLGSLAILLAIAAATPGPPATAGPLPAQTYPVSRGVHPAVVRVMAPERDGMSLGSGTLVAVEGDHGLVVTNWHVVRDAADTVWVAFPNGFRSPATVMKTDRVWDLAALAIWRPNVEPVRLASAPPRPGEPLTIAGYGGGSYRAASGTCTQYVAPASGQAFEMVELSVAARQGDSGGPILNSRGELAGVLFGSGLGCTSGSYCGRVQRFLATVEGDFRRLAPNPLMIAQQSAPGETASAAPSTGAATPDAVPWQPSANYWTAAPPSRQAVTPSQPSAVGSPVVAAIATESASVSTGQSAAMPAATAVGAGGSAAPVAVVPPVGESADVGGGAPDSAETTVGDQLKTFLAVIGVFALLFHGVRMLGTPLEPAKKPGRGTRRRS